MTDVLQSNLCQIELSEQGIRKLLAFALFKHKCDEGGLHQDFETWLECLAPENPYRRYRYIVSEDNADAHLKRTIRGRKVVVAVT